MRVSDVDIRLLRIFVAVAEAGGFTAAQPTLDIGTSTISLHMTDLEARIGFVLCERGRRGFSLTDRGHQVYQEAKRLLNQLEDFSASVGSLKKRLTGQLRIGAVDAFVTNPHSPLVGAIKAFNALENAVHIQVIVDERVSLEKRVLDGDLHLAISPFVRKISGLQFRPLLVEQHSLYCGHGHSLFGVPDASREALRSLPIVTRSHQGHSDMQRFAGMQVRATVNNMECMLGLLLSGDYIGLLPNHFARDWSERGLLWRLSCKDFNHDSAHALVTATARKSSLAASTFIPLLIKESTVLHHRISMSSSEFNQSTTTSLESEMLDKTA